jgi:hypothetical protein
LILTPKDVTREFLSEATNTAVTRYRDAIRPIYGVAERGEPNHIGSGLLLDVGGSKRLLTAAHVLDHNIQTTLYLGGDQFAPLEFEALSTEAPGGDRNADKADFAMAPLPEATIAKLTNATFINEADISPFQGSSEGRSYACLGFPNSKNKISPFKSTAVVPNLGIYSSVGRPASQLAAVATDQDHILVDYDPKTSRDQLGNKVPSISIRGFSGG